MRRRQARWQSLLFLLIVAAAFLLIWSTIQTYIRHFQRNQLLPPPTLILFPLDNKNNSTKLDNNATTTSILSNITIHNEHNHQQQEQQRIIVFETKKSYFHFGCCLNNLFLWTVAQLETSCRRATALQSKLSQQQQNNNKNNNNTTRVVAILPPTLDQDGAFVANRFQIFNSNDIQHLKQLANRQYNRCILISSLELKSIYENNNNQTTLIIERRDYRADDMVHHGAFKEWFYHHLKLPKRLERPLSQCYPKIHIQNAWSEQQYNNNTNDNDNYIAVHARIEGDWIHGYCITRSQRPGGVKMCFTPTEIAHSTSKLQLFNNISNNNKKKTISIVLIHGRPANNFTNHDMIWNSNDFSFNNNNTAVQLHHKSWIPQCNKIMGRLTFNERAMLDLWVAIHARAFVGHLGSSFTNGVTQARHARNDIHNFVYSCPHIAPLLQRRDQGQLPPPPRRRRGRSMHQVHNTDQRLCQHAATGK